jgi:hypothetical protein
LKCLTDESEEEEEDRRADDDHCEAERRTPAIPEDIA